MVEDAELKQSPVGHLVLEGSDDGFYRNTVKGILDVVAAAVLFVGTFPLVLAAIALTKIDSPGPAVYRQTRIGRNGKPFVLYKIRTMEHESEMLGFKTQPGDERITRLGRMLRDSKIDELPQLLNVICGQMSLVGPRPLSLEETEYLVSEGLDPTMPGLVPTVLPGLTGLEQCTRSSLHPFDHRFWLNHYYEKHVSMWMDLWILKRTFGVCPIVCLGSAVSGLSLAWLFLFLAALPR